MAISIASRRKPNGDAGRPARKGVISLATAILSVGLVVAGVAGPASARDVNGWVWSHYAGQTQLYTTMGDSTTYMTKAQVQHFDSTQFTTTYCGAQAKAWGTLASGSAWSRTYGYQSGCWFVMVDETTAPNQYFRGGSNFYGQAYHDGAWAPGTPSIHP